MDTEKALEAFGAISQRSRLDILRLLVKAGADGIAAGEIADAIQGKQNTTSTNLAILTRSGLIAASREGRSVIYRADYSGIGALLAFLLEDCCGGRAEICGPLLQTLSDDKRRSCC
ncbi:metalloregulator ArsR/SmtB family transcription factor [Phyllobacterium sp. YR531]|uniref:ArsR/SmtB family transcription factor n=1 Tax=Phyllobacterium sp. YR531 TaxID=1144343 RepID=UPI0002F927FE|nr:metalloregulator ArsR/SmtB family transcription factor [Phyllobacterium sp. YR531]